MRKRCKICGCYLDPGEWCRCDEEEQPEQDMAKRPVARKPTVYPREYNSAEYINARWQAFFEN